MTLRAVFIGLLMMGTIGRHAAARDKLALRVSPAISFAPANLTVRATIEADAGNRAVEIIAESTDFYRSSEIELDGDHGPRTSQFEFRSLPPGTYEVKGILYGSSGTALAEVRQQVDVIPSGTGE
jgi:hypothetical protein